MLNNLSEKQAGKIILTLYNDCPICNNLDFNHINVASIKDAWKFWIELITRRFSDRQEKQPMITEFEYTIYLCKKNNIVFNDNIKSKVKYSSIKGFFQNAHIYASSDLKIIISLLEQVQRSNFRSVDNVWTGQYTLQEDTVVLNQHNLNENENYIHLMDNIDTKYLMKSKAFKTEIKRYLLEIVAPESYKKFLSKQFDYDDLRMHLMLSNLNAALPWNFERNIDSYSGLKPDFWRWREI